MSTWTSRALLLAGAGALAACQGFVPVTRAAPTQIALAGSSVVVTGPPGFCIDPAATRDGVKAFVLMGSCASIAGDPDARKPAAPGLVTVTVSSDPDTFVDVATASAALERFFRSDAGRATLSRSGRAESVRVLDSRTRGGTLYFHVRDTSPGGPAGTVPDYWRALTNVGDTLVTVTVVGFENRPIAAEEGRALIEAAVARVRAGTGAPA